MTKVYIATERRPDGAAFIIAAILASLGALLIWQGSVIPDKGGYAGIGSGEAPRTLAPMSVGAPIRLMLVELSMRFSSG